MTDMPHPESCPLDLTRRHFLGGMTMGLGAAALGTLSTSAAADPLAGGGPHFAPRAKRIIFLFQSGGPSQLDLFDHKPRLVQENGQELPDSVRKGQRLTGMSGNQSILPLAGAQFKFDRHARTGGWFSELVPHTAANAEVVQEKVEDAAIVARPATRVTSNE